MSLSNNPNTAFNVVLIAEGFKTTLQVPSLPPRLKSRMPGNCLILAFDTATLSFLKDVLKALLLSNTKILSGLTDIIVADLPCDISTLDPSGFSFLALWACAYMLPKRSKQVIIFFMI